MNRTRNSQRKAASLIGLVAAGALALATSDAQAQVDYPNRPIRVLVGFPAGTSIDTVARRLGDKLQGELGQPVIVENIPGAGGNLAADRAAKSEADGYTLVMAGNASIVVNQSLYEKLSYDPVRDLTPISQVAITPNILVVHPEVLAKSAQELAELARKHPEALTYAHAGLGISQHLAGELFNRQAKVTLRPIVYRNATAMLPDLVAGRVSACFCNIINALPLAREGKLRALAVTSLQRAAVAPDLPTMDEAGFPGFEATAWFGLLAPAGTPPAIVARLSHATSKVLADTALRTQLEALGITTVGNSPEEFTAVIQREVPHWDGLIKSIGLKIQ